MALIDREGRLFGKLNIVDLLIVLLIMSAFLGYMMKKQVGPVIINNVKPIEITVMVASLRPDVAANIQVGDQIFTKDGNDLAVIKSVAFKPAKFLTTTDQGIVKIADDPWHKEVTMVLGGNGTSSKNTVKLGNTEVRAGTELNVRGIDFEVIGQIQNVKF